MGIGSRSVVEVVDMVLRVPQLYVIFWDGWVHDHYLGRQFEEGQPGAQVGSTTQVGGHCRKCRRPPNT